MALQKEYFELSEKYAKDYGEKTILLMQVGAFFEVYGIKNKKTNEISDSTKIKNFGSICELAVVDKNVCVSTIITTKTCKEKSSINDSIIVMAGFKDMMIEKYIKKLQAAGFTTVVYTQDENMKNTTRSLFAIISPGTYFSNDSTKLTNHTTCIWIERIHNTRILKGNYVVVGIANVDIYTGKTTIFQYQENYIHNPTTYDELERFISIYQPSEVIFLSNLPKREIEDIIQFTNIQAKSIHTIFLEDSSSSQEKNVSSIFYEKAKNCEKQVYQKEILIRFYKTSYDVFIQNFYDNDIACQAFCFLLDFIYQHNPHLIHRLDEPVFENQTKRMVLANHSLKQLNIIDDHQYQGPYSSVLKMLNKCQTPMGKRKFAYQLLNPTVDQDFLKREYAIIEYFLDASNQNHSIYEDNYKKLCEIKDLAKWERQVFLKKITPKNFYHLNENLLLLKTIYQNLFLEEKKQQEKDEEERNSTMNQKNKFAFLSNYLSFYEPNAGQLQVYCEKITEFIEKYLILEEAKEMDTLTQFETNFICQGIDPVLDARNEELMESLDQLEAIREFLNDLIDRKEKGKGKSEYVKIHETEKNHFSLISTNRRCKFVEIGLADLHNLIKSPTKTLEYKSSFDGLKKTFEFSTLHQKGEFTFLKQSGANCFIQNAQIQELCKNISLLKGLMKEIIASVYQKFLTAFEEYKPFLETIIQFVTLFDVAYTKSWLAKKYHYSKPQLVESEKSFVQCKGLRHILVEQLNTEEIYVTNDLLLGKSEIDGILLYGTNAVGKTCFIKALGISIIMAQAGLYVPCIEFVYQPYTYLFTRILGNDNLFKGLSTFAVEMSELRTILRLADKNSLVLGDELCSGTENISAISIFMSGIMRLYEKGSSFIFATHLHEIVNYEEIRAMTRLVLRHMEVVYDKEKSCLVYDRKLREGSGSSLYGLEVCKSLNLPEEFLDLAFQIRVKYYPETGGALSLHPSHYNVKKLVGGLCEKCGLERSVEVHHLIHQASAGEDGFILDREKGIALHKNHPANLMSLCEKCHKKMHLL